MGACVGRMYELGSREGLARDGVRGSMRGGRRRKVDKEVGGVEGGEEKGREERECGRRGKCSRNGGPMNE